jgi:hypothetical protein
MRGKRPISAGLPGIIVIMLGLWLAVQRLGWAAPGLGQLWPLLLVVTGLWLLASYALDDRDAGSAFAGTALFLAGAFLMLYTFRVISRLETWWPAIPVIGGLAFLAQWAASEFKGIGSLWMGLLALTAGVVALPFTLGVISHQLGREAARLWPLVLIVVGLVALLQVAWRVDRH